MEQIVHSNKPCCYRVAAKAPGSWPARVTIVGRVHMLAANRLKWRHLPEEIRAAFITPQRVRRTLGVYEAVVDDKREHAILRGYWADRMSGLFFGPLNLVRALYHQRPDLVHVDEEPSTLALLQILLLKPLLGYRVVFFTWENLAVRLPAPFAFVRRLALRWADGAVAGNSEAAERLRAMGFARGVVVIPQLGVDSERFCPDAGDRSALRSELGLHSFTIGYLGRMVAAKGLYVLLDSLAQLERPWQILLVGRGPDAKPLMERARTLGLDDRLIWLDTVPHADMPRYLRAIDVLVLPSLTTAEWKEQFGHILIEAMACETPVVGSTSGAIPEVVGDGGLVVPEGDPSVLAEALDGLIADPAGAHELGRQGRQRVLEHFANERVIQALVTFWRTLGQHERQEQMQ